MGVPPRPRKGPQRPSDTGVPAPTGLPSSHDSDTAAIVNTIVNSRDTSTPAVNGSDPVGLEPRRISLDQLAHRPNNPRNPAFDYDPLADESLAEFAVTMKEVGQLQTVTVVHRDHWLRTHPDHVKAIGLAPWVVVMGNRRLAAARVAGLRDLRIEVDNKLADPGMADDAALIENYHRKGLDPIEEAEVLHRRLQEPGATLRSVGERIGISHTQVRQRVALRKLIPEFKRLVSTGRLAVQNAQPLAELDEATQKAVFDGGPPFRPEQETAAAKAVPRSIKIRRGSTPQQIAGDLTESLQADELRALVEHLVGMLDQEPAPAR